MCGKPLVAAIPDLLAALERHGELQAGPEVRAALLAISPATVDRYGHDYLKQMCDDVGYAVVPDIESLPSRITTLYRQRGSASRRRRGRRLS